MVRRSDRCGWSNIGVWHEGSGPGNESVLVPAFRSERSSVLPVNNLQLSERQALHGVGQPGDGVRLDASVSRCALSFGHWLAADFSSS